MGDWYNSTRSYGRKGVKMANARGSRRWEQGGLTGAEKVQRSVRDWSQSGFKLKSLFGRSIKGGQNQSEEGGGPDKKRT